MNVRKFRISLFVIVCIFNLLIVQFIIFSNVTNNSSKDMEEFELNAEFYESHNGNTDNQNNNINSAFYPDQTLIGALSRTRSTSRTWGSDNLIDNMDTSDLARDQINPKVVSDNDQNIYCTWQDERSSDWKIYFSASTNLGTDWTSSIQVSNITTSFGDQQFPAIAVDPMNKSNIYIVWQDERNDDGDIYVCSSSDGGETWSNDTLINEDTPDNTYQWYPAIACDTKGNVFVVWSDNSNMFNDWDIKLSVSNDLGKSWSEPLTVNDEYLDNANQIKPDIHIDNNDIIYVVWEDDRNNEKQIFFSKSKNSGKSFQKDITISKLKDFTSSRVPDISVDENNNLFIVWLEDFNSLYNVYFTRSMDAGSHFSTPLRVNDLLDKCQADAHPVVQADYKGNIYVAWADYRDFNHIYISYSTDNGKSFSSNERIDDADDTSATSISITTQEELERTQTNLVLLKNKIAVFWTDYRNDPNPDDGNPYNGDIYFDLDTAKPNTKPEKPEFVKGSSFRDWWYLNLSWVVSDELDFARYKIYHSIKKDFTPDDKTLNATITDRLINYNNFTGLGPSTTYYFRLRVEDLIGNYNISDEFAYSTKSNIPPVIELIEPDGSINDLVDTQFDIIWEDSDPDDNATITLYYDKNLNPNDGKKLITVVPYGEDSTTNFYSWDTTEVQNGSYYIVALISDPVNGEQYPVYSMGKIKIYHGNLDPWLKLTFMSPNNATGVELTNPIVTIFNKELDTSTLNEETFSVTDSIGNNVKGNFEYDELNNKLFFFPLNNWKGLEKYWVNLTTSIKDASGLFQLENTYSWWFETKEEIILNGTIIGDLVNINTGQAISGAKVILTDITGSNVNRTTFTDNTGEYSFIVDYGNYELAIIADGYQTPDKLTVNLSQSAIDLKQLELVQPFIIDFNIEKSVININEELSVFATATHEKNEVLIYHWNFGDGVNKTGQNLTHKYNEIGIYEVILTVMDSKGGYTTETRKVEVKSEETDINDFLSDFGIPLLFLLLIIIIILLIFLRVRSSKVDNINGTEVNDERIPSDEFEGEELEGDIDDDDDEEEDSEEDAEDVDEEENEDTDVDETEIEELTDEAIESDIGNDEEPLDDGLEDGILDESMEVTDDSELIGESPEVALEERTDIEGEEIKGGTEEELSKSKVTTNLGIKKSKKVKKKVGKKIKKGKSRSSSNVKLKKKLTKKSKGKLK